MATEDEAFRDGWEKGRSSGFEEGVEAMREAAAALALDEAAVTGECEGEIYIARKIANATLALLVVRRSHD